MPYYFRFKTLICYNLIMAEKDIISKQIIKRLIEDISKYLFELELETLEVLETQFQRPEERRADIVVKVSEAGRHYLLHIEIQNDNDQKMPNRMLRYRTDINSQWPKQEIEQYLIYIGKNKLSMDDGIKNINLDYHYHLIDMHQIDCQSFLTKGNPDALILAILCDFKGRDEREIIHFIITELKKYHKENEQGFRESISMLEALSTNRNLKEQIKEEEEMLSARWDELPSYEIGFEKGEIQGEIKGKIKGKIKGEIKGAIKAETKIIIKMLPVFNDEKINEYTGASLSDIKRIRKENS